MLSLSVFGNLKSPLHSASSSGSDKFLGTILPKNSPEPFKKLKTTSPSSSKDKSVYKYNH